MRFLRFSAAAFAALAALALGAPAQAEPIGATLKVVNQVTAQFNRDTRTLLEGDGVSQDEVIAVGSDALSELVFKDETKLALGPGSLLKLDKFVYDPEKSSGDIAVNLLKGTFRFMTGVAAKPTYVIRTPTASITVRGTIFDVYVFADGGTWLLLHEGAIAIRNERGKCRLLDTPGRLIRITTAGDVGIPVDWEGLPGSANVPFDDAFPFVASPPSMDPKPVFTRAAILAGPPSNPRSTQDCDETDDSPPVVPTPRRADTGDGPVLKKAVRRVEEKSYTPAKKPSKRAEEKVDKPDYKKKLPAKVVIYDKPKKKKKDRGGTYGEKDDNVKIMDGVGIAIGIGIGGGFGKRGGGHKPGGHSGGQKPSGYGGGQKPSGYGGGGMAR